MFKHMKFSSKMMTIPLLAIVALAVLFVVSQYFNERNKGLLKEIETGFVPALEWAYNLNARLTEIQRTMQDAVGTEDEEELVGVEEQAQEFREHLLNGKKISVLDIEKIVAWEAMFNAYYSKALEISLYLIDGGTLTEAMVADLQQLNADYNRIKEEANATTQNAKEQVSTSFAITFRNNALSAWMIQGLIAAFSVLFVLLALLLSRSLTRPLKQVFLVANELARGKTDVSIDIDSRDEIGKLAGVFRSLIQTNNELARAATAIGNGEYDVPVNIRSEEDVLGNALAVMKTNLIAGAAEIETQNWLKSGLAELSLKLRGEKGLVQLAQETTGFLAKYLDAQIGAFCISDPDSELLKLVGSYAYHERKGHRNAFRPGEGLIGQAALEKQRILFSQVPEDYIKIRSELGEITPQYLVVLPFLYEDRVKGVLELGSVRKFTDTQLEFLEQAGESIAIALHSAQTRFQTQELLEETQRQSDVLLKQQQELQTANEELEEHTQVLRSSEEKLQQQQEELRQTNEELEEQAGILEMQKRELGRKNLDLQDARTLLEEKARDLELSSQYKSEFLSNMSHELRTPLNSMLILSKLLAENKKANLNDKQVQYCNTIHSSGAELLSLINDVLDLSKVEAGKMILNLNKMSLKSSMDYILQHFQHMAEERLLYLRVELEPEMPDSIYTDRQRVEQILKNFLSNALKFTEQGGVIVNFGRPSSDMVGGREALSVDRAIAISVHDTGIGIPADKQRSVFGAFQQADGTTSRKYGGTGLGLSITRELAHLLGGDVHLSSEEGKGSVFSLILPEKLTGAPSVEESVKIASVKENVAQPAEKSPTASPQPEGIARVEEIRDDRHDEIEASDKFLLIVEDDAEFARLLFDLSRQRGFKALIAGDGAAGLQLADQYVPSAIILDVGLPGMDGWTVMEKLKSNPATRHIPVHFISGHDAPLEALKMGAIGYLTKPVELAALQEMFTGIEARICQSIRTLLLVEDDEAMRTSMKELLDGEDITIVTASTGHEAYNLLQSQAVDCMVLDLGLSDISGFDLVEKIKQNPSMSFLPIIIYTGRDLSKEEQQRLEQQAESIIIKGVKSSERLLDEVTLFLHRVETELPEEQQKKIRQLHDRETVLTEKTVLMVDDDMRNIFALSSVLEEKGMRVLVAENGKEALEMLDTNPEIELVLMDIMMPEMDGYQTMQEIRKDVRFSTLPMIALTAKAMKGDRQKSIDAGANDYLSKPVDIEKLLSLLRVWLY